MFEFGLIISSALQSILLVVYPGFLTYMESWKELHFYSTIIQAITPDLLSFKEEKTSRNNVKDRCIIPDIQIERTIDRQTEFKFYISVCWFSCYLYVYL